MKEDEEENYTLIIPADVKTRMELINGVGVQEMIKAGIAFGISTVIALILNTFFNNFFIVITIVLLSTAGTIIFVMKDKNHQSLMDIINNMIKFSKMQKFYPYEVKQTYEMPNNNIEERIE